MPCHFFVKSQEVSKKQAENKQKGAGGVGFDPLSEWRFHLIPLFLVQSILKLDLIRIVS